MAVFLTGATGYIGSYLLAGLFDRGIERVIVLARDPSPERLWRAMQLHWDEATFRERLARIELVGGDLTRSRFGLSAIELEAIARRTTSVLHCAASLNRKSERQCLAVNLKGTLEVVRFARTVPELSRFSFVSTSAVAGERQDETVAEDRAIDWERRDYDPYARTKKFCEHLIATELPDVSRLVFRPSVVLGDSTRPETTQFDMVQAFAYFAQRWTLPLRRHHRLDIVPVDYVRDAIVALHLKDDPAHGIYHLSAGEGSATFLEIVSNLSEAQGTARPWFWPWLKAPFTWYIRQLARAHGTKIARSAARLEVFMPYLTNNTVFDNTRVAAELGRRPAAFSDYSHSLLAWSLEHGFRHPHRELGGSPSQTTATTHAEKAGPPAAPDTESDAPSGPNTATDPDEKASPSVPPDAETSP